MIECRGIKDMGNQNFNTNYRAPGSISLLSIECVKIPTANRNVISRWLGCSKELPAVTAVDEQGWVWLIYHFKLGLVKKYGSNPGSNRQMPGHRLSGKKCQKLLSKYIAIKVLKYVSSRYRHIDPSLLCFLPQMAPAWLHLYDNNHFGCQLMQETAAW